MNLGSAIRPSADRPDGQAARGQLAVVRQREAGAVWPRPPRLVHRATDNLSAEAWKLLLSGFRGKLLCRRIAEQLVAIGEPVAERTIARRAAEWRAEENRGLVLAELNEGLLASGLWRPAELIAVVEAVDLRAGWPLRCRRRLWKAVHTFLKRPNGDGIRAIESELFLFWLTTVVFKPRVVGHPGGES